MRDRERIAQLETEVRTLREHLYRLGEQADAPLERHIRLVKKVGSPANGVQDIEFLNSNQDVRKAQWESAVVLEGNLALAFEQGGKWFLCSCGNESATVLCQNVVLPASFGMALSGFQNVVAAGHTYRFSELNGFSGTWGNMQHDASGTNKCDYEITPAATFTIQRADTSVETYRLAGHGGLRYDGQAQAWEFQLAFANADNSGRRVNLSLNGVGTIVVPEPATSAVNGSIRANYASGDGDEPLVSTFTGVGGTVALT